MKCPICGKPVARNSEFMPFCGERCKLIDLGNWASERYRMPSDLTEDDIEKLADEGSKEIEDDERPNDTGKHE